MKKLILATALLSVALSSCVTSGPVTGPTPPDSYTDAESLFLLGEFEQSFLRFETFMTRNGRSPYISDARYWAGICALKLGNVKKARAYISRTYARPRTALLGNLALIGLADCDYMENRFSAASSKYRQTLDRAGTQKARVLYQLGMCSNRLGKLRDAQKYFREVTATYPGTKHADLAEEKLKFTGSVFSVQVGAFDSRENAETVRSQIARRRFSPYIQPISRGGKLLHCVRVGRFKTWKQANDFLRKLKAIGFDAVIVP